MNNIIKITLPNDMHVHFREGEILDFAVNATAKNFHYAIAMPNLKEPIVTYEMAINYYEQIKKVSKYSHFKPLVTLYMSSQILEKDIIKSAQDERVIGVKLYPAGVTTNSEKGVGNLRSCYKVLEWMEKYNLNLLIHGEVSNKETDIFDREKFFIDELIEITKNFPNLKVIFEHISTKDAVQYVESASELIAATITPQHLILNRNDFLSGGIRPHNYCLPVLKREEHRKAIERAATSGNSRFFLGTDSAPHFKNQKESACGCAGVFSAANALELYLEVFEKNNALDQFENFAVNNSSSFYNLEKSTKKITFVKKPHVLPSDYSVGDNVIVPFKANETASWKVSIDI